MIRLFVAVAAAVASVAILCACDDDDRWSSSAPWAPSLLPSWGVRETDGTLRIWMGTPCRGIERISLGPSGGADLVLTADIPAGVDVEYLTLGGPYPGFTITQPWPENVDWRDVDQLILQVDGGPVHFGAGVLVSDIVNGSAEHPEDTYWFDGVGWLNKADVATQDGKTFTAVCTPDPGI